MLRVHADDTLQAAYLPRLVSGQWPAAMSLTEPQAGSDLSTVRTLAKPDADAWLLTGRKIFISSTSSVEHIAPNLEFGPLADRTVREALYFAINKQAIIDALNYGLPRLTERFVPQQAWSFQQGLPQHHYDPAKANALLDAAGWTRGAGGVRGAGHPLYGVR